MIRYSNRNEPNFNIWSKTIKLDFCPENETITNFMKVICQLIDFYVKSAQLISSSMLNWKFRLILQHHELSVDLGVIVWSASLWTYLIRFIFDRIAVKLRNGLSFLATEHLLQNYWVAANATHNCPQEGKRRSASESHWNIAKSNLKLLSGFYF